MKLNEFDYRLPPGLIAQFPTKERGESRLLILNKKTGEISHDYFFNLNNYLSDKDIIITNNSKVFPARIFGIKETGGAVEILLTKEIKPGFWESIGRKLKVGQKINFNNSALKATVKKQNGQFFVVCFNLSGNLFFEELEKIGKMPLPPYIKREQDLSDHKRYQTVYAKEVGSIAAPTAGLHFTQQNINEFKKKEIDFLEITLHVGLGTFLPVKNEDIKKHQMHTEFFSINKSILRKIINQKNAKKRIIAVGTTTTRTLEHLYNKMADLNLEGEGSIDGSTDIFIYPGYNFKCIDGLITNFHLPKSTLLMLVSAFAGIENIKKAYKEAIKEKYRFYSYGDAMLII